MMMGILFPAALLGLLVALAVVFFQRRESLDLSPRGLLRGYLYLASLAGIVTLAIGLGSLANYGIAAAFGTEVVYGGVPMARPAIAPACPPGDTRCAGPTELQLEQQRRSQQTSRRHAEDVLRGITFTAFGVLFWAAHWAARRRIVGASEHGTGLRRGYLMLGAVLFGLVTIVMLPTGLYQALAAALLPAHEFGYRQPADSLGGGIAALPIWLVYLRELVSDFRATPVAA